MKDLIKQNIILIGMPGVGKSTLGVVLAKRLAYEFLDTDLLIQAANQRPLQEIVDTDGYLSLRALEEETLLQLTVHKHVISTGGSAVYSEAGMRHLKNKGLCIFLEASLETIESRIDDFATRGIAKSTEQTFADAFVERSLLYSRYADIVINCDTKRLEEVCDEVMVALFKEA